MRLPKVTRHGNPGAHMLTPHESYRPTAPPKIPRRKTALPRNHLPTPGRPIETGNLTTKPASLFERFAILLGQEQGSGTSSLGALSGGQVNRLGVILGPVDVHIHPGIVHFTKGGFLGPGNQKLLQGRGC